DILREIQSTLMDTLEDRNPTPGQAPAEETVKIVLKEFGSPRQVASQYGLKNYLIGPRLFPIYVQVLKLVLIIIAALNILSVIIAIVNQSGYNAGLLDAIAQIIGGLFNSLFTGFGIVTLSFAGIERTTPEDWKIKLDQDWQPEHLLRGQNKQRVKVAELAIEITLALIFIALINFFLDRIGIYYLSDSGWVSAPILNDNFLRYIPWITAYAVMDIALDLYLIRKGFWDNYAVLAKIFINIVKIAVAFAIITGPIILTISSAALQGLNIALGTSVESLSSTLNTALDVVLGLSILGLVVDSIRRLYETFIKGQHTGFEIDVE
ncbi:MAG: hypothetical protein ACK2TV_09840, partial [Anaerolineales bacterium]